MTKQIRRVGNKMTKTIALIGSGTVRRYIPPTARMNRDSLLRMLRAYSMVYIKPCDGSLGIGVMRVERRRRGRRGRYYQYRAGTRKHRFAHYKAAYRAILRETKGKPYLVQRGIRMLKHGGRPFDIRVMVQRNPAGQWEATGAAGRVAHPRKIVTNGSQGGSIYPVGVLLKKYTGKRKRASLIARMNRIGMEAARRLDDVFPGIREIGVDYAVDRSLKPWILEVNTSPDPCPFARLADKRMLRRIVRCAKSYGRTYRLKCTKAKRGRF